MDDNTPQLVGRETVWEGGFIRVVLLSYQDSAGRIRKWEAVERVNCAGIVAVIPVTAEGDILFIRQFRPALNRYVIEFPAGLNDKRELLCNAALRELVEETGYSAERLEFLAEGPVSSGLSSEQLTVFLARNAEPASGELRMRFPAEETETIEVIRIPLMGAYDLLDDHKLRGDLIDLKIYGLLELARTRVQG